jgi:hypothetical protein
MVPVARRTSSPDEPGVRTASWSRHAFEVRCADAHPAGCAEVLDAERAGDVVALAREHGTLAHGFTAVWYGPEWLAVIAAAATEPDGGTR